MDEAFDIFAIITNDIFMRRENVHLSLSLSSKSETLPESPLCATHSITNIILNKLLNLTLYYFKIPD
jgi:hypothetical protein